jgi:hypothetical protein
LQKSKLAIIHFIGRPLFVLITWAKYWLVYFDSWPITALILCLVKECCFVKMHEFSGPKRRNAGKSAQKCFALPPSYSGSDSFITHGGNHDWEAITFKGLLASIVSKLTVGWVPLEPLEIPFPRTTPDGPRQRGTNGEENDDEDAANEDMDMDGGEDHDQQRGRSRTKRGRSSDVGNNNDNGEDEEDNNNNNNDNGDDLDEFDRLARDTEKLKILLKLAVEKKIEGSATLTSSLKGNEALLTFISIRYTQLPKTTLQRGYVLYKIKEINMADLNLQDHWQHPKRWTFLEVANKSFVIPSFLYQDFARTTRLAHKRGNVMFETALIGNPLEDEVNDWAESFFSSSPMPTISKPLSLYLVYTESI